MSHLHLFGAYGVELEYMIVDAESLEIKPISDLLLRDEAGTLESDVFRGQIAWSNELVMHVIELKCARPTDDLRALERNLHGNVIRINSLLKKYGAMLLPTAMHPFMNPDTEMHLWPHDNREVYEAYDKLFNCRGHGWSNVQSTHLNLPFNGDKEFCTLHSAIRLLLPLLPALCASSPLADGKMSGALDTRLKYYRTNQSSVPSFTGLVIPEAVTSRKEYESRVYMPIKKDIESFGLSEILDPVWVNSRGAIARFDRGSIEVRLMDVQECPKADLAVVAFAIQFLRMMCLRIDTGDVNADLSTEALLEILDATTREGENAIIDSRDYLNLFEIEKPVSAKDFLSVICQDWLRQEGELMFNESILQQIISQGTLATRISKRLGGAPSHEEIVDIYKELSACLSDNRMFIGDR